MHQQILQQLKQGNIKTLARVISLVENNAGNYFELLMQLPASLTKVTGITGPPGAGKSTITDALIGELVAQNKKVGVLCVDPSSPFNHGALLGDRVRMSEWFNHPNVFIRSLATRGSLGGLHPKIIEITDVIKAAGFDHIIIETVGVGQSEVEIAGLADTTVVVVVPESGDEIQTMKSGLMEIADVFAVNKADRPDADLLAKNLKLMLMPPFSPHQKEIPIIKTIATQKKGIKELFEAITTNNKQPKENGKREWLLAEKAYQLIQANKMKGISKEDLQKEINAIGQETFNLYRFVKNYLWDL